MIKLFSTAHPSKLQMYLKANVYVYWTFISSMYCKYQHGPTFPGKQCYSKYLKRSNPMCPVKGIFCVYKGHDQELYKFDVYKISKQKYLIAYNLEIAGSLATHHWVHSPVKSASYSVQRNWIVLLGFREQVFIFKERNQFLPDTVFHDFADIRS